MKRLLLLYILLVFATVQAFTQLTIQLVKIPDNTPTSGPIFIVGNFNNWAPGDPNYQLLKNGSGIFSITIEPPAGLLEYKFTRGSWDAVEGDANGGYLPNRTFDYDGTTQTLELEILSWEGTDSNSTAAANVSILDENFFIPQLNRNRRIWLYLPPDYFSADKRYPVLYMHDGQNLFDQATSFGQEWQVDESLNTLFEQGDYGIIVVGIDNGGSSRTDEYLPWSHPTYGGGEGGAYINFIVETLKPYIDQNYRSLPEQEFTGIMGSSLGALISSYGIIEHQDIFGKAGCFSSSFWLYDDPYEQVTNSGKEQDLKIYLIAGQQESSDVDVVADMYRMEQTLYDAGFPEEQVEAIDHADGQHSEWYWAREFPAAYEWLFGDVMIPTGVKEAAVLSSISVYPNPGEDYLLVELEEEVADAVLEVYDFFGELILREVLGSGVNRVGMEEVLAGGYGLRVSVAGEVVKVLRWVKAE